MRKVNIGYKVEKSQNGTNNNKNTHDNQTNMKQLTYTYRVKSRNYTAFNKFRD